MNKYCEICGKELTGKQTKFCSKKCKDKKYHTTQYNNEQSKKRDQHGLLIKYALIKQRGGQCELCGYNKNISALQFHHKNPDDKRFTLDARTLDRLTDDEILEEFSKCVVLCANCHSETHHPNFTVSNLENIRTLCKDIKSKKHTKIQI